MKKVYGMGFNDCPNKSNTPQYIRWASMIQRCYDLEALKRDPSYMDTYVCLGWLRFSTFSAWMDTCAWKGKCLDKDLSGENYYSPETCLWVSPELNKYWTGARGSGLAGANYEADRGKWKASLKMPGPGGKKRTLGRYTTEQEAHEVYMKEKIKNLSYFLTSESPEVVKRLQELIDG